MVLSPASLANGQRLSGSNAERSRAFNRSLVLGKVREAGATGRAQIARATGLSTQAVSNIIGDLLADGWLHEAGKRSEGRGQPAMQYVIAPCAGAALGIEIRPAAVLIALVGVDGRTLFTDRVAIETADPDTLQALLPGLCARALENCTRKAGERILGAGVVMPGPFGSTGLSGAPSDLPGWAHIDAQSHLENALGLPVTIENDANAAAMAERVLGVAQDIDTFAYLYFGTGLGLGLVMNGALQRGAFGNAGEIGHVMVPHRGALRPLEQAVSRMALQAHMEAAGKSADRVEALQTLLAAGHPALLEWLDDAAPALSQGIAIVENLLDPQTIVLGGAVPQELVDALLARTNLPTRTVSNRPHRKHDRLLAGTCGRMTAPRGAAALVINTAFTPHIAAMA
ncbi:MAG: ROK family protein [Hyphomicrobiales bacterium]|jgi:predicted NBD/HSP70 family sugar kinase